MLQIILLSFIHICQSFFNFSRRNLALVQTAVELFKDSNRNSAHKNSRLCQIDRDNWISQIVGYHVQLDIMDTWVMDSGHLDSIGYLKNQQNVTTFFAFIQKNDSLFISIQISMDTCLHGQMDSWISQISQYLDTWISQLFWIDG